MFDQETFNNPARVIVTVNFYKRDMEGNITVNDSTGARFWTAPTNDGSFRMVATVDKAQNVTKNGHDISAMIAGKTVDLRLKKDDYKLLKAETKTMEEGVGAQFIVELSKPPVFGELTITNSKNGRNGNKRSTVLIGEIAGDEIRPAQATLTDSVKVDTLDEIKAHFDAMEEDQRSSGAQARAQAQAARQSLEAKSTAAV